ncbi:bifunctional riboflavin kinase/FMN phosphatase-like isoform X1 [Dioscorea cayenensis subsp. rotundata]|uniref:Bifunctional riboflavin kinase/FMN phosphatase-like isoform X1 n=1 Tax=Dioscorea cayennensis subsp. rotundata TaxID=55577 RepID=A0AB40BN45_DIOCR|nr:bifunctional riboflavin kinase/FMN phosphatase-like isoform X1 [Dioscorea cayenensis subsp. rotundata]
MPLSNNAFRKEAFFKVLSVSHGLVASKVNHGVSFLPCVKASEAALAMASNVGIVNDVLKRFLLKYNKQWNTKVAHNLVGKTSREAATIFLQDYGLPLSVKELMDMITRLFSDQWYNIKAFPCANRLIKHLSSNGVPMALASNPPKLNMEGKISDHHGWKESFLAIVGGDDVINGKQSPDIFPKAAKRINTEPSNYLVIEDSL